MTYEKFEIALIYALAETADNLGVSLFSFRDLAGARDFYFEQRWIGLAEQSLKEKGFIDFHGDNVPGKQILHITGTGREHVRGIIRKYKNDNSRSMRIADLDRYDWFLLGVMFHVSIENEPEGYLSAETIQIWEPHKSPKEEIEERLRTLVATRLAISHKFSGFVSPASNEVNLYRISTLGTKIYLRNMDQFYLKKHGLLGDIPEGLYETVDKFLDNYNQLVVALDLGEPATAPASDRVVSLDHNNPDYQDAVRHLEKLKGAIESNNEFRNSNISDHERRLTDVESTLKLLENMRVNVNTMKAVAFGTLAYLVEKFAEHPIGELAKAAWNALKSLLGIG